MEEIEFFYLRIQHFLDIYYSTYSVGTYEFTLSKTKTKKPSRRLGKNLK